MPPNETPDSGLSSDANTNLNPAVELEITEILDSARWLATQLVQVATVLTTANIALIGFAVSGNRAGLFLLGAGVSGLLYVAYRAGIKGFVPLICRLLTLEDFVIQAEGSVTDTAITTLVLSLMNPEQVMEARSIDSIANLSEKRMAMKSFERDLLRHSSARRGVYLLLAAISIQISLAFVLAIFFGWSYM